MIGEPGIQFGATKAAAADPAVAANSASATRTAIAIFDIFFMLEIPSQPTFASLALRELTHIPGFICPPFVMSMFDANFKIRTPI